MAVRVCIREVSIYTWSLKEVVMIRKVALSSATNPKPIACSGKPNLSKRQSRLLMPSLEN